VTTVAGVLGSRRVFVGTAALAQLAIWLGTRPDLHEAGAGAAVAWLVGEAVAALVIGGFAAGDGRAARAVLVGWGLQMAHFALVAPKGEDGNLWAVGLFVQAFFAAVALALSVRRTWSRTGSGPAPAPDRHAPDRPSGGG
jgi:hypothetical protein